MQGLKGVLSEMKAGRPDPVLRAYCAYCLREGGQRELGEQTEGWVVFMGFLHGGCERKYSAAQRSVAARLLARPRDASIWF